MKLIPWDRNLFSSDEEFENFINHVTQVPPTREELKAAFKRLEEIPLRPSDPLMFCSEEFKRELLEDFVTIPIAPLEGAAQGGHDVRRFESEEELLMHGEPKG